MPNSYFYKMWNPNTVELFYNTMVLFYKSKHTIFQWSEVALHFKSPFLCNYQYTRKKWKKEEDEIAKVGV
jgi:hypothetical protein